MNEEFYNIKKLFDELFKDIKPPNYNPPKWVDFEKFNEVKEDRVIPDEDCGWANDGIGMYQDGELNFLDTDENGITIEFREYAKFRDTCAPYRGEFVPCMTYSKMEEIIITSINYEGYYIDETQIDETKVLDYIKNIYK